MTRALSLKADTNLAMGTKISNISLKKFDFGNFTLEFDVRAEYFASKSKYSTL